MSFHSLVASDRNWCICFAHWSLFCRAHFCWSLLKFIQIFLCVHNLCWDMIESLTYVRVDYGAPFSINSHSASNFYGSAVIIIPFDVMHGKIFTLLFPHFHVYKIKDSKTHNWPSWAGNCIILQRENVKRLDLQN